MSEDGDRISAPPRALRRLVEELREEPEPSVDWAGLEARMLAQLDLEAAAPMGPSGAEFAQAPAAEILVPWDDDAVADEAEELPNASEPPRSRGPARSRGASELGASELGASELGASEAGRRGEPMRLRLAAREASSRRGMSRWLVAGIAAVVSAAAAFALAPRGGGEPFASLDPVDLGSVASAPRLVDALDLAGLRAGDVVEAVEGPVTFGREGVLSWTLSAGGRLRVVAGLGRDTAAHVVALEAGALDVEVVPAPSTEQERFVVEVEGARVAVHGTAFQVVRSSRGLVVDVSRGVVAVGPLTGGVGSGRRLEAPARASFSLDGGSYRELPRRSASLSVGSSAPGAGGEVVARATPDERYAGAEVEILGGPGDAPKERSASGAALPGGGAEGPVVVSHPAPTQVGDDGVPAVAAGPLRDAKAPPASNGASPKAPPAAEAAAGTSKESVAETAVEAAPWSSERVRREVHACIRQAAAKGGAEARVTVASKLVVDVDAAGAARAVRFEPPIRPELQACAQSVFRARFARGTGRLVVPVEVVLPGEADGGAPPVGSAPSSTGGAAAPRSP